MSTATQTSFKPKKGRPTAAQTAAIEKTILDTARVLFFRDGFDAVAMESVVAAAGVSKGTLYARYPSKEDLFHAVIEACVAEWANREEQRDQHHSSSIEERLRYHALTIARSMFDPEVSAFRRLLFSCSERFPETGKAMYEVGYLYMANLITKEIKSIAKSDGVPVKDAAGVARHLMAAIVGYHLQVSGRGDLTLKELEKFSLKVVDLLMAARSSW